MNTYFTFLLYAFSTFLLTVILFPVVVFSDINNLCSNNKVISEEDFIADLFNP